MASTSRAAHSAASPFPPPPTTTQDIHASPGDPADAVAARIASRIATRLTEDHKGVLKPDVDTPFIDEEDVVARLLPYHVYQQPREALDFVIRGGSAKRKGKAKVTQELQNEADLRREIAETKYALSCAKRFRSLEQQFTRIRRKDERLSASSTQNYLTERLAYEADRIANMTLQAELHSARQELARVKPSTQTQAATPLHWSTRLPALSTSTSTFQSTASSQTNSPTAPPPGGYQLGQLEIGKSPFSTTALHRGSGSASKGTGSVGETIAPIQLQVQPSQNKAQAETQQPQYQVYQHHFAQQQPHGQGHSSFRVKMPVSTTVANGNGSAELARVMNEANLANSVRPPQATASSSKTKNRGATPGGSTSMSRVVAPVAPSSSTSGAGVATNAVNGVASANGSVPPTHGNAIIPVQLPITSIPALQALDILPKSYPASASSSTPAAPATLISTTATTASLKIAVGQLSQRQMTGLAVILSGLMGRSGGSAGAGSSGSGTVAAPGQNGAASNPPAAVTGASTTTSAKTDGGTDVAG